MLTHLDIGVDFSASCQNCYEEIHHDGDTYVCERCRIYFDERTTQAYYLDDGEPQCGRPYPWPTPVRDVYVDRNGRERKSVRFDFPCDLPASHTSDQHHHPKHYIHCIPEES